MNNRGLLIVCQLALWIAGMASMSFAEHPFPVTLKDADGNAIATGTSVPYSPKQTCGVCHIYEAAPASANKDHGTGSLSYPGTESGGIAGYNVPYPGHGVTAGFHFQQGRSTRWGDIQRTYYGLAGFTSSPGMYGKY